MACVGRDNGEAILEAGTHVEVIDTSRESAIADGEKSVVPLVWEEQAESEGGSRGRSHINENGTEWGQVCSVGWITRIVWVSKCGIGTVWYGI